jgi:hypothetical protein
MSSITLNPVGGHFGDGDGFTGFLLVFFLTVGFLVGVAFLVAVAFGVGVAFAVAFIVALGVGVGDFVAANPCEGISARQSPITNAARLIDHST